MTKKKAIVFENEMIGDFSKREKRQLDLIQKLVYEK